MICNSPHSPNTSAPNHGASTKLVAIQSRDYYLIMRQKTILVVEDQPEIRRLIILTLNYRDFVFVEAETCEKGLLAVQNHIPDLVLLDIMTPGNLDGYDACRALRLNPVTARVPIIMLSARGQKADFQFAVEAGSDAYLIKPFSPIKLIEIVEYWLAKPYEPRAEA